MRSEPNLRAVMLLLIIALLIGSLSPYRSWAGINDGLVAYYPFDGNVNDYGTWQINGTVYGIIMYESGAVGQAARFDGTSKIIFPNTAYPVGTGTISMWIKIPSEAQLVNNGFGWLIHSPKSNYRSDFAYNFTTGLHMGDVSTALIKDQWVLCTFVYTNGTSSSRGLGKAYVNGMLKGSDTGYINNHSGLSGVGLDIGSSAYGLIDEIRIYNRALSEAEIQELYQQYSPSSLNVVSPNGGNLIIKGQNNTITWNSNNITGNVQIDLYKGVTNILQLAASAQNTGNYPFNPPSYLVDGADYRIGISAMSGTVSDVSDTTFTISSPTTTSSWIPLYRLYKSSITDHFYTTSSYERDRAVSLNGFSYERTEGFLSATNFTGSVPLYRLYSAAQDVHYYTTNVSDRNSKVASGYADEDVTGYLYSSQNEWTSPLYYASHAASTDNFYTTSWYEYQNAIKKWGFSGNGIIGYVATRIANNRPQGSFAGVGLVAGNYSLPAFTDLSLNGGVGPQISFTRYYDSFSPGTTLGQGWSFNYDSYINKDPLDGGIHVEWGNGSESHFYNDLTPYPGYFDKIAINGTGYDITTKDQTKYSFTLNSAITSGPNILLTAITDKYSNSIVLDRNNPFGLVKKVTDATGRTFDFIYGYFTLSSGVDVFRLMSVTDNSLSAVRAVNFSYYGTNGNLFDVTDALNNITKFGYNNDGLLSTITYPEGNTVNVTYNAFGQVTGYTNGNITLSFDHNATLGTTVMNGSLPLVTILPDSQKRADRITYAGVANDYVKPNYCPGNLLNLQCDVKDRNGNISYFTYDANGNLLTAKNPLNETVTYTYDAWNNMTSVKDPRNNNTIYTYDATRKYLLSVQKPMGGMTKYTYRTNGLVEKVTDPTDHSMTYSYDANGNVTKINDDALGTSMDFTNDGAGRRKTQTDLQRPIPQLTTWEYDNNDNVTSMKVASNQASIFRYDKNNLLYNVVDQRGKTTVFNFNTMNLMERMISPDLKTWQYSYDSIGNLSTVSLPDGGTVSYTYDANRRLQFVHHDGAEKLFYTYDNNGNVLSLRVDNSRTTYFVYNVANRVTSITDPFNNIIGYGYDAAGNRTNINYPGNKMVNYTYDADNRLAIVKDWLGAATTTYNYNSAGILRSITNTNGTTTSFGFDPANRLTSLTNKKANSSIITDYGLVLDKMGNPTSITRNEPLAPPIPAASDISYSYDDANQIQSAGSVSYTHDSLGNLKGASNGRSFVFDYANRLTSATIGSDNFSFVYDAFGNRISRTKNGLQTRYILGLNADMSNVLAETNSTGTVQNYYIHGLGLISRINSSGQRFTYHYDQLGNTVAATDDSNTVTESYSYDEFGQTLASSGTTPNPFRYVGKFGVMDEGNGLLHMRARYYDTNTGRFLSRDPLGFEGGDLNLYAYVEGNPIKGIDPEGLVPDLTVISRDQFDFYIQYQPKGDGFWGKVKREVFWNELKKQLRKSGQTIDVSMQNDINQHRYTGWLLSIPGISKVSKIADKTIGVVNPRYKDMKQQGIEALSGSLHQKNCRKEFADDPSFCQ